MRQGRRGIAQVLRVEPCSHDLGIWFLIASDPINLVRCWSERLSVGDLATTLWKDIRCSERLVRVIGVLIVIKMLAE